MWSILWVLGCGGEPAAPAVPAPAVAPTSAAYTLADVERMAAAGRTVVLLDVRPPAEFAKGTVPGARNVPLARLEAEIRTLPKDAVVVTICRHGAARSQGAARRLRAAGFVEAGHLEGGVDGQG